MQSNLYVSLSGQLALQRRLDTIAHNMANVSTTGFRSEEVKFDSFISRTGADPVAFATRGETYISRDAGALIKTDNPLDVAVQGDAWLAINTPAGPAYTRDGRMKILPTGELVNLNNYPILDVGLAPLALDPRGGAVNIARDGMISQNGQQIGAIGLFTIDENTKLTHFENSSVVPDNPATPALDFTRFGVVSGFIERGNVNPVIEMTNLITVTRAFDAITAAIDKSENSLEEAIRTLGSGS
ncbi:MAG: flagellar basal-body rod protein FlgF [Hyphomicrobiales bacterium]|nr:flagellar basal-body rod protein FlgF [Hyphomicrobiales bacterium]